MCVSPLLDDGQVDLGAIIPGQNPHTSDLARPEGRHGRSAPEGWGPPIADRGSSQDLFKCLVSHGW